ncbi:hypothetical protein SAMN04489761_3389 [Tenacibaculum sp. MAR_2009_124]|uniref:hypothetical protein n=1 Tax=Tenacibaculum sp. MAR_2009_124 TaxID=1250059 RepID=UPI00089919AA|nr:hypothetical protein [Tenacibaculum sp. MAR_2009_124]SEC64729.1 hypothetical protein SAMN04489761_3389 [Tenacibaculum sp. MAR_2009_124]
MFNSSNKFLIEKVKKMTAFDIDRHLHKVESMIEINLVDITYFEKDKKISKKTKNSLFKRIDVLIEYNRVLELYWGKQTI